MFARTVGRLAVALCAISLLSGPAFVLAKDPPVAGKKVDAKQGKVEAVTTYRVSTLTGMNVKNREGKDIGKIEDMLVDIRDGRIGYGILSFGGVLGIGDKLFPIPWRELTMHFGENESFLVADVSKEFLEKAPSFARSEWPTMNANWRATVDALFPMHAGTVMSVTGDHVVLSLGEMGEHSYPVASDAAVTRDGAKVGLGDLKKGDHARVKTHEQAGIRVVTRIEAESGRTIR